jgi:hypothetical protein
VAQVFHTRRQPPYFKLFPPDMPQGSTLTLTARMTKPAVRSKHRCWRFGERRGPSEGSGTDWLLIPEEQPEPVISYFQRFFACRRPSPNFFGGGHRGRPRPWPSRPIEVCGRRRALRRRGTCRRLALMLIAGIRIATPCGQRKQFEGIFSSRDRRPCSARPEARSRRWSDPPTDSRSAFTAFKSRTDARKLCGSGRRQC